MTNHSIKRVTRSARALHQAYNLGARNQLIKELEAAMSDSVKEARREGATEEQIQVASEGNTVVVYLAA